MTTMLRAREAVGKAETVTARPSLALRVAERARRSSSGFLIALATLCALVAIGAANVAIYRTHGPAKLPDPHVTPGQVRTTDVHAVCAGGSTKQYRHTTDSTKQQICLEYGLGAHCYGRSTNEIDHLISLELGGADEPRNLWPQPYNEIPGAHEKDQVENYLHREVCANRMTLTDAQQRIAFDWYAVYIEINAKGKKWPGSPL